MVGSVYIDHILNVLVPRIAFRNCRGYRNGCLRFYVHSRCLGDVGAINGVDGFRRRVRNGNYNACCCLVDIIERHRQRDGRVFFGQACQVRIFQGQSRFRNSVVHSIHQLKFAFVRRYRIDSGSRQIARTKVQRYGFAFAPYCE